MYDCEWNGLRQQDLEDYDNAYLGQTSRRDEPYYCLFNNKLTASIPPCFIAGAEFDPLTDNSVALFKTLQANNIPCEYKIYSETLHAFLHYSRMMKIADDAIRDEAKYFINQLL